MYFLDRQGNRVNGLRELGLRLHRGRRSGSGRGHPAPRAHRRRSGTAGRTCRSARCRSTSSAATYRARRSAPGERLLGDTNIFNDSPDPYDRATDDGAREDLRPEPAQRALGGARPARDRRGDRRLRVGHLRRPRERVPRACRRSASLPGRHDRRVLPGSVEPLGFGDDLDQGRHWRWRHASVPGVDDDVRQRDGRGGYELHGRRPRVREGRRPVSCRARRRSRRGDDGRGDLRSARGFGGCSRLPGATLTAWERCLRDRRARPGSSWGDADGDVRGSDGSDGHVVGHDHDRRVEARDRRGSTLGRTRRRDR